MQALRQSTATIVPVGPFVDGTDGKTLEAGLDVTGFTVDLHKHIDALPADIITNGAFASDTGWMKGTNWQIGSGVASQSSPSASDLEQTPSVALVENQVYVVTYTVASRTAGAIVVKIGGTSGTSRTTNATFTEIIVAGSGSLIEFTADGTWDGTIDDVTLELSHLEIVPTASGGAHDMVHANQAAFYFEVTASDVAILGRMKLVFEHADSLPRTHEFMVLPANVYDSMYGSDTLKADVTQWLGTAAATPTVAGVPVVDVTHLFGTILAEGGAGRLAGAFNKLLDVETPLLLASAAMRGTENGALASVCTEGRLAELDAGNLPTDVAAIPLTAMRGTDNAALASVCTEGRLAELDAGNMPSDLDDTLGDTNEMQGKLPAGALASSTEVLAIQNSTHVRVIVPQFLERPDSGSKTFRLWLYIYDTQGAMEAPDSLPTVAAENDQGTDRSSGLSVVTNVSTGVYRVDYTVADSHAIEGLRFQWSIVEGGATRVHAAAAHVVDTTAVDFTAADRTKLDTLHDTRLTAARASNLDNLDAAMTSRATPAQVNTEVDNALDTVVPGSPTAGSINERIKTLDDNYTSARAAKLDNCDASVATNATHLTDLKGATFDSATDSNEAIRNRGDAAWTTGSGTGLTPLASGTAQGGANGSITLAAGSGGADDLFKDARVLIVGGTGNGQSRLITAFNDTSDVADVDRNWVTNPDATSVYEIQGADTPGGSGSSPWDDPRSAHNTAGSFGEDANQKRAATVPKKIIADPATGIVTYRNEADDGDAFKTKTQETGTTIELVDA